MARTEASPDRNEPQRPLWKAIGLWGLQVAIAAFFIMSGASKLAGAPEMIALFDAVGVGQWLRYVTGTLELVGAGLLLVPSLATLGGATLATVMVGATAAHAFVIGGSALAPLLLLAGSAFVAHARRARSLVPMAPLAASPQRPDIASTRGSRAGAAECSQ